MIVVASGDMKQDKYTSGTYNGIFLNMYMVASALNNALAVADFDSSLVSIKVLLKSKDGVETIMQDNLKLLAAFNTLSKGAWEFQNGLDIIYPSSSAYNNKLRTVFLDFGGHIRLDNSELLIEVIMPSIGVFTSNVNVPSSYLEFYANPSVGYSAYIPFTQTEVVQAATTQQSFNIGDNITKLAFLNFDKNDLSAQVISSLNIQSDRLDVGYTFNQLLANNALQYSDIPDLRMGSVLPISLSSTTGRVYRGLPPNPQSMIIWNGERMENELDQCRINCTFNGANVASSNNYFAWRSYKTTQKQINEALNREAKHMKEKIQKTATS